MIAPAAFGRNMTTPFPEGAEASRRARRHLTILFADLSGYTTLSESVDPDQSLNLLQSVKRVCERVVTRHGGMVHGSKGDGVMAIFGFPESIERAARAAVEAALELRDAIREVQIPGSPLGGASPRLHTGVHAGLVTFEADDVSMIGGEAPNIAARLSDLAVDDEILVSAATLGGDRHCFDVKDRGALRLPGKEQPIAILQVLGRSVASTRFEARTQGGLTPFVGRSKELDRIDAALGRVIAGGRAEVAIVAPAGVGKTRLAERFLLRAAERAVRACRGYCENHLGAEPLQPFLQMLRQLARAHEGTAPASPVAPHLARALTLSVLSSDRATTPQPDEAAGICANVFVALARHEPLVLFVDDWQWADAATRQVLVALRQAAANILVLTASRDLPPLEDHAEVVHLPPFGEAETYTAILALWPEANPFQAQEVQRRSGGNALYIEELCHWALPEPIVSEGERSDALPTWLSTLIESRVARLPEALAAIVRTAAVIGTVVPTWLLEQVTGHDAGGALIAELAERDLLYCGEVAGTLRFKHGITRDVIYASIPPQVREQMHRRVAGFLEQRHAAPGQETLLEVLSYHFRAGAMPEQTALYAELAGDRALAAAAPDRARSQYLAALAAIDLLEPSEAIYRLWSAIVHRLGLACAFDPSRSHLTLFERAVELSRERGDHEGVARAEYWLGFIQYALGDNADAIRHYERALESCDKAAELARALDDSIAIRQLARLSVQLVATVGQALAAAGEHDRALPLFDRALAVKRHHRRPSSPAVGLAYTLACKGAALGDLGRFEEAQACFEEALDAIRPGHLPVESAILGWRSAVLIWQGRWEEARETGLRAQGLAHRAGSLYVLAQGQAAAQYAAWMIDRSPAAIDALARATSWLEHLDRRLSISINYGWLAETMAVEGRSHDARHYAQRAIERAAVRDPFGEAAAYRALARVTWDSPDAAADAFLDRAMLVGRARRSLREEALTILWQGRGAVRRQRAAAATQLLIEASRRFSSMDMAWHHAQAQHALASLNVEPSGSPVREI